MRRIPSEKMSSNPFGCRPIFLRWLEVSQGRTLKNVKEAVRESDEPVTPRTGDSSVSGAHRTPSEPQGQGGKDRS